jgi:hypothetical protein
MTKAKKINENGWKPLTLKGAILSNDIEGLIGIEELTDYNLERSNKKGNIVTTKISSIQKEQVNNLFY